MYRQRENFGVSWAWVVAISSLGASYSACSPSFEKCKETRTCLTIDRREAGVDDSGGSSGASMGGVGNHGGGGSSGSAGAPIATSMGGNSSGAGGGSAAPDSGTPSGGRPDAGDGDAADGTGGALRDAAGTDSGIPPRSCPTGFLDCNHKASDGCEVDMRVDPAHCGSCAVACSALGTTANICNGGVCKPTCDATHLDCDGDGKNGCEVDVKGDADHCGSCTTACSGTGTSARACNAGLCKPTCDATHLDCDGDGKNGCEVDAQSDAANCGACKYACSKNHATSTSCVKGACTPVCATGFGECRRPAPAADDGCETDFTQPSDCGACKHSCLGGACGTDQQCNEIYLARDRPAPSSVTATAEYVDWTEGDGTDGAVMQIERISGTITPIATGQALPQGSVSDGTFIYWCNTSPDAPSVQRKRLGTTASLPPVLVDATNAPSPCPIAVDGTYLYWFDGVTHRVGKTLKDGSGPSIMLTPSAFQSTSGLAVDATNVYYATNSVQYAPLSGTSTELVLAGNDANTLTLAIDATYVYYQGFSQVNPSFLARRPKTPNGAAQTLSPLPDGFGIALQMAVDANYLYVLQAFALYKVPKAGGTPILMSTLVSLPTSISLTSDAIYWTNPGSTRNTGSVMKLAL